MYKKILTIIFTLILSVGILSVTNVSKVYAEENIQGNTRVELETDKKEYSVGDMVKVSIKCKDVVDLFGIQFTLHYDPAMLEMQGDNITFEDGYKAFGGVTVDKKKGVLTYPLINQKASSKKQDIVTVGSVTFKALKNGPVVMPIDNIKAVNSKSAVVSYNTQYQAVYNISQKSTNPAQPSSGGSKTENKPGNQGNNTAQNPQTAQNGQGANNPSSGTNNSNDPKTNPNSNTQGNANTGTNSQNPNGGNKAGQSNQGGAISTSKNGTSKDFIISLVVLLIAASTLFAVKNRSILKEAITGGQQKDKDRTTGA